MIATVKIIPFVDPRATLEAALEALGPTPAVSVAPFRPLRVAVVSTLLPGLKESVIEKTLRALRRGSRRPARASSSMSQARTRPPRSRGASSASSRRRDVLVVFGASAITDRRDVIPAAIEAFGGRIERFGMPVDPGNLLLLARTRRKADHRRARLRALAQGERLRLGAAAGARRRADRRRRHPRDGRRRTADGDRLAAAAARAA